MEGFVDVASVNDVPVGRAKSLKLGERIFVKLAPARPNTELL
jgi:hypothetical protein